MERGPVDRSSPGTPFRDESRASQRITSRSRSPSSKPAAGSNRSCRERSRSPLRHRRETGRRKAYHDRDSDSYRDGYSRRHRYGYPDEASYGRNERHSDRDRGTSSRRAREHSCDSPRKGRLSDGGPPRTSQGQPDAHGRHHSGLSRRSERAGLSPTPTPPDDSSARHPPPGQHNSENTTKESRHHRHHRRSRSRSDPSRRCHSHRHHHTRRRSSLYSSGSLGMARGTDAVSLPFGARALSRWDFAAFEPLFAYYLELQKQIKIADLDEREVRGRWKRFVGRWNRGELAEGWYEPEMFLRVVRARSLEEAPQAGDRRDSDASGQVMTPPATGMSMADSVMESMATEADGPRSSTNKRAEHDYNDNDDDDEDEDWIPPLPPQSQNQDAASRSSPGYSQSLQVSTTARSGPAIPTIQDLELRRTMQAEEQQDRIGDLRLARKADRKQQTERLEELVPRAEPGTRERQLEKRRAVADMLRDMRGAAGAGGMEEVGDSELMGGGGEDGAEDYKRVLATMQRRKTERELRREEFARARNEERNQRIQAYKEREEETVAVLRELARQRFG